MKQFYKNDFSRRIYAWEKNTIVMTLFFTFLLSSVLYYIGLQGYYTQIDLFYQQFNAMSNEVISNIEEANIIEKNYQALIEADKTYGNQVAEATFVPNDIKYMTPFRYTYREIFMPSLAMPKLENQYSWLKYIYAKTNMVHLSDSSLFNMPPETLIVGSRYGYSNTENSGVLGLMLDLKTLISEVAINQHLLPENIVVSAPDGSIIYHVDYNNATKPTLNEIYTYGDLIDSNVPSGDIQKVYYRGEKFISASMVIIDDGIQISLIKPWSDVFYSWQMYVIVLVTIGLIGMYIIFINVKNYNQLKRIKRIYSIEDRSFTDRDFEIMQYAIHLRENVSNYFDFELSTIVELLALLKENTLGLLPEVVEEHENRVIHYMQHKMKRLQIREKEATPFGAAPLESFDSVPLMNMLLDFLRLKAVNANTELVYYVDEKANQVVYGYPNAIWITSLFVFEQLQPYQDKIYVTIRLRGELIIGFRTVDYIKYDDINIKRISNILKSRYQIDFTMQSREINIAWPVIKKGHLPSEVPVMEANVILCGYKVDVSTERVIKHFVEQGDMTFKSISVLSHLEGIVIVSTEQLQLLNEDELEILKAYPQIILLHPSTEMPYVWAERIDAKGILSKPLKAQKLRQVVGLIQSNLESTTL